MPASALPWRLSRQLDLLRSTGVEMPQTPQAYVQDWLGKGWLRREYPSGVSEEQYFELTANAADALRYLMRLSRPRSAATESKLASVLQLLQALADATDENPETRVASLLAERQRLDDEIDAVRAGRFTTLASDRAAERAREVISQGEELLGDFDKVEDASVKSTSNCARTSWRTKVGEARFWRKSSMASTSYERTDARRLRCVLAAAHRSTGCGTVRGGAAAGCCPAVRRFAERG